MCLRLVLSILLLWSSFFTFSHAGEAINKIGITMVDIPSGNFMMGSCLKNDSSAFLGESTCTNSDQNAGREETPQHKVNVGAFQLSKTEVTLGQFKRFIKETGNTNLVNDFFMRYNAYGDNAPVVMVSWNDAQAFIAWLNKIEGGGHRLPSEAEWEYACRAGGNHTYCGSNNINAVAWYGGNSGSREHPTRANPHPVGEKQANAFGLHDMSGNASEWVQDCWHNNYAGAPTDGSAWSDCRNSGFGTPRVLRGGAWSGNIASPRSNGRNWQDSANRREYSGFRIARDH